MIKVSKGEIVLESRTEVEFEKKGVLNPTCVEKDNTVYLFYRAIKENNFSTLGFCQLENNRVINRSEEPFMVPEYRYECHGIEDPRITYLEGMYYLLYTAYDGQNALVAYATSSDLKFFTKRGLVTPQITYDEAEDIFRSSGITKKYIFFEKVFRQTQGDSVYLWEKDAMIFPRKINGNYAILHRILPGIQICYFKDFDDLTQNFWRQYLKDLNDFIVLDPKYHFENSHIGAGCVPIETAYGWLLIYHSAQNTNQGIVYHACAALLDKNNPQKVIGRLTHPLFSPETDWEKSGIVNNVVFPTGAIVKEDTLFVYYGAADTRIGVRTIGLSGLLKELST